MKFIRKLVCFGLLIWFSTAARGQGFFRIDSLRRVLDSLLQDTGRMMTLARLCFSYAFRNTDSGVPNENLSSSLPPVNRVA